MTRHEIREAAFLALFQYEFFEPSQEWHEQVKLFLEEDMGYDGATCDELEERLEQLGEQIQWIDSLIEDASLNWTIRRMNKVDLAILRLAVFEMKYEDLEVGIAINEAVELAKAYGTDESGSFVNGILGKVARAGR